ncbi:hypothetical protein D3C87_119570 [compost metagenome]
MKSKHSALSISISERITEILDTTGLSQTEFAIRCELNPSILRNYRSNSRAFTVESISRICAAVSVSLIDFFDFGVPLEIDPGIILQLHERAIDETIDARRHRKQHERDCIGHMISNTRYFDAPIKLNQIIKIIRKEYGLYLTADRVYNLLKRHIGQGTIIKEYKIRTMKEREAFQPKEHRFQKKFEPKIS